MFLFFFFYTIIRCKVTANWRQYKINRGKLTKKCYFLTIYPLLAKFLLDDALIGTRHRYLFFQAKELELIARVAVGDFLDEIDVD